MTTDKTNRNDMQHKLIDILSKSATFKMLDNEINPCTIAYDGMEFIIYIKNLTPARLKNNNPDVWRIQLPIRHAFEQLKDSDIPFIVLGYDAANNVYTTWNPYWVKQRLNVAKSVSLYSRLSLQQKANINQSFQSLSLNNDGEVIAFPCTKLGYYLINIKQFFPEMTDYVAIGSRKRIEANAAFHILCDSKNIANYAHYLEMCGKQKSTISSYCRAIKKLITEGYFSRNRKVFLACNSLSEYPTVIDKFIAIPEVQEINDVLHYTYSCALKLYIQYLLEINNIDECLDFSSSDPQETSEQDYEPSEESSNVPADEEQEVIDWEDFFTDSNGKLTRIANPQLIDLLRPVLDVQYKKLAVALKIVDEFYSDRFRNTMELKDWSNLLEKINWQSPYYSPEEHIKGDTKQKQIILKVTTPDGKVFAHRKVLQTLVDVVQYAGIEKVKELNIIVCGDNIILDADSINPRYATATKYVDNGLYVNTCSSTTNKANIIQQISDSLGLNLTVETIAFK